MSNGHAFKSVFSSCKIHTRNVSHFLFFDVTWNQIHFKLAFNIEILSFQIYSLWWIYKMRQNRRFISFVNHSLFHSWTNNFGTAIRFINTNPVSWTNRAENHPYLRIVILYIPMICFWMISEEYYFVVAKSLVDMVFWKKKERNIHIYDPLYTACIEKSILSWLNSRLKSPLWYEMRGVNVFKLITTLYKWLRYSMIRFK